MRFAWEPLYRGVTYLIPPTMNVLLVEGSPTIAGGIANHLKSLGVAPCRHVTSKEQALQRLQEQPPDLIIVGWELAGGSGVDFTRRICTHSDLQRIPVLMISPHDDRRRVLKASQAGVDGYLLRPFDRTDLAAKIEELASRARSPSPERS